MKLLPAPSLVGRVLMALLGAFLLVGCVLVAIEYSGTLRETERHEAQRVVADAVLASLVLADDDRARTILAATDIQYNQLRRQTQLGDIGDIKWLLQDAHGKVVYASAGLTGHRIAMADEGRGWVSIDGREHWLEKRETSHWRLQLLEPTVDELRILQVIGKDMLPSLLIALPLVGIPLWWVVRRGLRPLGDFVKAVTERQPNDFSPIGLQLRYQELAPLVVAFDGLLEKARRGIEQERGFVQNAAHELRTPLAVLTAQAHVLVNASEPAQKQESLAAMDRAAARASHLVEQLLALAALESGRSRDLEECDLVELTREILIGVNGEAMARQIDVTLESEDEMRATVDQVAFHSILQNLLVNAISYCPEGAEVIVTLKADGRRYELTVADNGPGIPEDELRHVFERFYRGRNATVRGSGLGLSIVRQAATILGGSIEVASVVEKGTRFTVRWPVQ